MNRSLSAAVRAAALRLAERSRIDAFFPVAGAGLRRVAFVALVAACFGGMRCAVLRAEEPPINAEAAQAVRPEPNEPAVAELPDGGEPSRETAAPETAAEPAAPAVVRPRILRSSPDDELTPRERGMLRLMEFVTGTWFLMLGASVGSFLNVVVYRMPLGIPLSRPKSRCPACLTPIARGDNIPIVSWLRLRGRCRSCHAPISPRYALVEAGTGLLWLGFAWCELLSGGKNLPVREPNGYAGVVWILWYTKWDLLGIYLYHQFLLCTLLAAALISLDGHRLPRRLLAVAAAVGFLAPVVWPGLHPAPFRLPHPEWLRAWRWSFSWSETWFSGGWRQNVGVGLEGALDGLLGAVAGGSLGALAGSIASRGPRRERHDAAATGALAGLYMGWQSAFSTALLAIAALVAARAVVRIARRSATVPPVACLFAAVVAQLLFWRALADVRSWPGPHSPPAVFGGAALVVIALCLVARALEPGDAAHVSTIGERPRSPISRIPFHAPRADRRMSKSLSRDEVSRIVRNAGLRQTEARLAVLERLAALDAPASHADMVERMSSFPYDSATIYRCLNDLADAGILARLELGDRTWRFEFRARGVGSQHGQHPHFLCLRCGRIVCLERRDVLSEDDRDRIAADAGVVTEILLKGVCHPCLESP